ncbi:hypothetical protein UY3_04253 [Chelonia mydas]|uniref:Uncharacterized protein n=1 Tax=Chelonia mydas TaxID=8469 RepID=M7CCP5_CHEMY|nr:hypothetical protein UY3_04253 [Chelonia mydas]
MSQGRGSPLIDPTLSANSAVPIHRELQPMGAVAGGGWSCGQQHVENPWVPHLKATARGMCQSLLGAARDVHFKLSVGAIHRNLGSLSRAPPFQCHSCAFISLAFSTGTKIWEGDQEQVSMQAGIWCLQGEGWLAEVQGECPYSTTGIVNGSESKVLDNERVMLTPLTLWACDRAYQAPLEALLSYYSPPQEKEQ